MSSTYTDLGIELMVTGANDGTWGTKTNTNLELVQQDISMDHIIMPLILMIKILMIRAIFLTIIVDHLLY